MQNKKMKFCIALFVGTIIFLGGFGLGKNFFKKAKFLPPTPLSQVESEKSFRSSGAKEGKEGKEGWQFISPLLDCGEVVGISNQQVSSLRSQIENIVERNKQAGTIEDAAIYFRDLNNGPWFGIKEKQGFIPASLLKVPLLMSVLKHATQDRHLLEKRFLYKDIDYNNVEYFKADQQLLFDRTYSINDALSYLIKYSDNNSYYLLLSLISSSTISEVYADLGVPLPTSIDYTVSPQVYSSFFRILYNSTFLSREYSEKALKLLSETVFDKGLVAGLPKGTKIAHKFGERHTGLGQRFLHDCGIVYAENISYTLCVMTKGNDFDRMASVIAEVSKVVYKGAVEKF